MYFCGCFTYISNTTNTTNTTHFSINTGDFIVSCSNDRSIRLWERTDEQVFLEEERERELEESFESSLNRKSQGDHALGSLKDDKDGNVQQEGAPDTEEGESGSASTRSVANVRAGEVRRRSRLLSQCGMDVPGTHLPPTFSLCLSVPLLCLSVPSLCLLLCLSCWWKRWSWRRRSKTGWTSTTPRWRRTAGTTPTCTCPKRTS